MTLNELQSRINRCSTLGECDEFLKPILGEVRPLFYGCTRSELFADGLRFDYEDTIDTIASSNVGRILSSRSAPCPDSVLALLTFFLSLFERTGLYNAFGTTADLLPDGNLSDRAKAVFLYKHITAADINYIGRFDKIVALIQSAWDSGDDAICTQCIDLLQEYFLDAVIEAREAGIDITAAMRALFQSKSKFQKFPIVTNCQIQKLVAADISCAQGCRTAVRSRIIESLHAEACRLVPEALLVYPINENKKGLLQPTQAHKSLPGFLEDQLEKMGARYEKQKSKARKNFDNDKELNEIYLGTFFPRTVIESWNIFSELLSIPAIDAAFSQKKTIRVLDFGSGTGGAIVGFLLALNTWGSCQVPVEITSIDVNDDALEKQGAILNSIVSRLPFAFNLKLRQVDFPFNLEDFVSVLSEITDNEGIQYDVITCWKWLSEFYNVNFAQAQGIVRHTLNLVSHMLVPYGLCAVADVTTKDNDFEYFSMTLNRETNEHDRNPYSVARTILPIPCSKFSLDCKIRKCFTQRIFNVNHQLVHTDSTKIAYRVLAPTDFATSIISGFREGSEYRVNPQRPSRACIKGTIVKTEKDLPCGYTVI